MDREYRLKHVWRHLCLRLFGWDPWYTRQNALYSIDPIQTREWARKITKGPFEPFVNWFLRSLEVAWQQTEQSHATTQNPFLSVSASQLETQATERLYKDAPPGIPVIILYPTNIFNKTLKPCNYLIILLFKMIILTRKNTFISH